MKLKTEQELKANYDRFIGIIKKYFKGERLEKLLHMYSEEDLNYNNRYRKDNNVFIKDKPTKLI